MHISYLASVRIPNEKASGLAISRQCEAFAQLGHSVVLVRPYRKNDITEDVFTYYGVKKSFTIKTLRTVNYWSSFGRISFTVTRLSQMIASAWYVYRNRKHIDVLYARDQWMLVLPLFFFPKPIVWEVHTKHTNWVTSFVLKKVKRIVAISEGLRDFYKELSGRLDIQVEPSGVCLEQFNNLPSEKELKKNMNLPEDVCVIGYVGKYTTMGKEKGVDELVMAFGNLYKARQNIFLYIVGLEESERNMVHKKCEEAGIPTTAFSLHELVQKRFAEQVVVADVLVMNYPDTEHYRNYMSPTKLFAYMASGATIVTTDLPAVRTILDDEEAVFVPAGNINALSDGLEQGINLAEKNQSISLKEKVSYFSWRSRGERILCPLV